MDTRTEQAARRPRLAAGLCCLVGVVLLAGCARPTAPASAPSTQAAPTTQAAPDTQVGPALPPDRNAQVCRAYRSTSASARTPLDAMRTEAVLLPFIDLIELSTQQAAQQGATAPDPVLASAMHGLLAAINDLDTRGRALLPPGADPSRTTVRLNPGRLAAALDNADRACTKYPAPATPGH